VLYPIREQRELAEHIPNATLEVLSAPHGHDSFLIEFEELSEMVTGWRTEQDVARSSVTA
jgi:homoserine O-acetyltransferase